MPTQCMSRKAGSDCVWWAATRVEGAIKEIQGFVSTLIAHILRSYVMYNLMDLGKIDYL